MLHRRLRAAAVFTHVCCLLALAWPSAAETLTPFYRGTQLQGHLFGMGLTEIPDYLSGADLALPYIKKPGFKKEIPFVDTFVINRVLGGYREDWLRKFGRWDDQLGRRSLDYVSKDPDGALRFRPDLIKARLQPYLDAGYKPSDITLALDNTPWDLATPDGQPPVEGAWGRKTPPGDLKEWQTVVRHFAADLKAYLGDKADEITFETGIEFDEKVSFDADSDQFFRYYEATDRALHSVLPDAGLAPGEFTAAGVCAQAGKTCVYDSLGFVEFARREGLKLAFVPRSLHALAVHPDAWPSMTAQRSLESFERLPGVIPEIHQFGLLYEPLGLDVGADPGPLSASWQFQTLARLMQKDPPRRVFHWGGLIAVGNYKFLNGAGFVRLALDHYLGADVRWLAAQDAPDKPFPAEVVALALARGPSVGLILSSYSPQLKEGVRAVTVALPAGWKGTRVRLVRYRASQNVFLSLKRDMIADGDLRSEFAACALCISVPQKMTSDMGRARRLIVRNWPRYVAEMHASLKWIDGGSDVVVENGHLTAQMEGDEFIVAEPAP